MFHVAFVEPRIPANTGNAIRMSAATGAHLHLVEPLGFTMTDAQLRRAGLDYHDLATVTVHADLAALWQTVLPARVFAFTTRGSTNYADVRYRPGTCCCSAPSRADSRRTCWPTRTSPTGFASRCWRGGAR